MSHMRDTMASQPALLRELLADAGPVEAVAERLRGRRVWLCGTGTSWHAANHGAWFLLAAGVDARAVQAADAARGGPAPVAGDGLLLLSHTGAKRDANAVLERARKSGGVECVVIGARGREGIDLTTSERERSSAYTASHLGALTRLAQLAIALGADLGELAAVPDAVAAVLDGRSPGVAPPPRLLQYTGAGANQWTGAEGALKVRETARVAADGLSAEQLLHGPLVTLGERDALVVLDGGGPAAERLEDVARLAEHDGARTHRIRARDLGEPLSVFPLTAAVQRIALEAAETLGTDPDAFGYDVPGRKETWEAVDL
jgi:glucosamine--fructose-6-phosphate aminotransferase (isomerizing)